MSATLTNDACINKFINTYGEVLAVKYDINIESAKSMLKSIVQIYDFTQIRESNFTRVLPINTHKMEPNV